MLHFYGTFVTTEPILIHYCYIGTLLLTEVQLETKIWALGVFIAVGVSLLLGSHSRQRKEIYVCILTCISTYIYEYFQYVSLCICITLIMSLCLYL